MKFFSAIVGMVAASHPWSLWIDSEDISLSQQEANRAICQKPLSLVQAKYGDVTVHIAEQPKKDGNIVPQRYTADSDDHLMNMLIAKGFAFSNDQSANLAVALDCGCNCNCCANEELPHLGSLDIDKAADAAMDTLFRATKKGYDGEDLSDYKRADLVMAQKSKNGQKLV